MSKVPLPVGDLNPYLIHDFSDPHESAPNGISIGSAVFIQLTYVRNTHRHTDHAACDVCSNRPHP